MSLLEQTAVFLAAAVVAVPLCRRLGLGAVLGYLAAGLVLGPWGLGLAQEPEAVLHFAEIGVVFLLFVIGLELQPRRLWVLRRSIFGLGLAQVGVTGTLLSAIAWWLGVAPASAWIVGFGLSLSSTAFVLQLLSERRELTSVHGRGAFGILLFQDLAVIPMLAVLPVVAGGGSSDGEIWLDLLHAVAVVVGLIVGGHYLLRPVLRAIAAAGIHEIFTAAALLMVIGSALLMDSAGLSMGLGAFLAGVLVADSEYRHQLEADIEPFKGLLLGLFFMSVGMSANLGTIISQPVFIVAIAAALILLKALVLFGIARAAGFTGSSARQLGLLLAQGGEFAFVLFAAARGRGLMEAALAEPLIMSVTLSMAATPLLVWLNGRFVEPRLAGEAERPFDTIDDPPAPVIIAGFGRFGQIIGRLLSSRQIPFTALETSTAQVDFVRRFGGKLYYGDASHIELLRAAHTEGARVFIIAVDDIEDSVRIAETVRRHFPRLKVLARARNRNHAHRLMDVGVDFIVRETLHSSLKVAEQALRGLGLSSGEASRAVGIFEQHDEQTLRRQYAIRNDERALIQSAQEAAEELQDLFESDAGERNGRRRRVAGED
ncbi:cation:proton antiporter [Ectothiorhodospiraceae bacterium WFHF3C12]|nr:cation:proton antiporter [Ectothiorhodospiraceae bacterium WFHF3C12]